MVVVVVLRRRRRHLIAASILLFLFLAEASGSLWAGSAHEQSGPLRRRLRVMGPGSSPPSCRSKCGPCTPCKAVHVPIQPGLAFPLEYYPEAWRCKCGNKLFMP